MCDEHARMLQDQFNVSMNHLQALAILVSTFHHSKNLSAIDQMTFVRYAERTAFERPLTSGVAYAVRVTHAEHEQFERQQGWSIKKMYLSTNQSPGPGDEDLALKEQLELYVVRAQDKVTLDCAVVRVSDLPDAKLDPDIKEAFDVAYDNIYAFHVSEKLPEKTVEHMKIYEGCELEELR